MGNEALTPQQLALAAQLPAALEQPVTSGQILLRFRNGKLHTDGNTVPPAVLELAIALRNTFGAPVAREWVTTNFTRGVLQSLERRSQRYGAIECREFFRVPAQKTLAPKN